MAWRRQAALLGLALAAALLAAPAAALDVNAVAAGRGGRGGLQPGTISAAPIHKCLGAGCQKVHQAAEPMSEPGRAEARAYGLCLLGSVAVVMSIFYLVNWPDEDIVANTWQTLSMTVSIFGAVLIYGTVVNATLQLLGVRSQRGTTLVLLGLFSVCFLALQALLLFQMKNREREDELSPSLGATITRSMYTDRFRMSLRATSTICAHVTGFAAMYCAAGLQTLPLFADSVWATAALVAAIGATLTGLCAVGAHLRRQVALADDGEISAAEEVWMSMVEDAENDVYALCVGFSIMQVIRFAISGSPQPYHAEDEPRAVSQAQAHGLLIACALLCLATAGGTKLTHLLSYEQLRLRRVLRAALNICSVAMAWCFLFWGEWQLYALGFGGVRVAGLLLVALCLTALSCALIVLLDFIADAQEASEARIFRTIILSLGLMVGFTWERAFHMGLNALSQSHDGHDQSWTRYALAIALACVVLPAWAQYILPEALRAREHNVSKVKSVYESGLRTQVIGAHRC